MSLESADPTGFNTASSLRIKPDQFRNWNVTTAYFICTSTVVDKIRVWMENHRRLWNFRNSPYVWPQLELSARTFL